MGMPLGGGSTWGHHADGFELIGPDDVMWGRVQYMRTGHSMDFMVPRSHAFDFVFKIWIDDGKVIWNEHQPPYRNVAWTPSTRPSELVTANVVEHATIEAARGVVSVRDARGVLRLEVRLGAADPAWGEGHHGALTWQGKPVAAFYIPTGPDIRINTLALSMP